MKLSRRLLPISRAARRTGASRLEPVADRARKAGATGLGHATSISHFAHIVESGGLRPRRKQDEMGLGGEYLEYPGVYFRLYLGEPPPPDLFIKPERDVLLFFSLDPLDDHPFHMNSAWYRGFEADTWSPRSQAPRVTVGRSDFARAIRKDRNRFIATNEVVVDGPVSLSALERIYVSDSRRAEVVALLEASPHAAPRGGWDAVVQIVPDWQPPQTVFPD